MSDPKSVPSKKDSTPWWAASSSVTAFATCSDDTWASMSPARHLTEALSCRARVRFAAVLFIDLVGSTQLAANRPPEEVAEVLNAFFRTVVDAVDQGGGLINKFQGDAALAVFGAPLAMDAAASAALRTARQLGTQLLHDLSSVDFGIGVSAGQVFAGNIGAENRYEYTVIGDAVNEAARIADLAKSSDVRILASSAATDDADPDERGRWAAHGSTTLRGRMSPHTDGPAGRLTRGRRRSVWRIRLRVAVLVLTLPRRQRLQSWRRLGMQVDDSIAHRLGLLHG